MRLRPTQIVLVAVVGLALALMGVPFFLKGPSLGKPTGVVLDARGFGIPGAAVYLFSEADLRLVEETRTDENGDFAFHLDTEQPRVFVHPPSGSGLLPSWSPSSEDSPSARAFVLPPAHPLEVRVLDDSGQAVPEAEVRVYGVHPEPVVLSMARTDSDGRARLSAPQRAHVAAFAPGVRIARWHFDTEVPAQGGRLTFELPPAILRRGRIVGEDGPLEGILCSSWEENEKGGWNGFALSRPDGTFEVPCSEAPTVLTLRDRDGALLPQRHLLQGANDSLLTLELRPASPLLVKASRGGLPITMQIWSWSPDGQAWSWGVRSSATGRATVPAAERFGIHASPLDPAVATLEAWDMAYGDGTLNLETARH